MESGDISTGCSSRQRAADDAGCHAGEAPLAAADSGCPPPTASNRGGKTYKEGLVVPVWQGIDSLEASFEGTFNKDVPIALDELKRKAQSSSPEEQAQAFILLGTRFFQVSDRGSRLFRFTLNEGGMQLRFRGFNAKKVPLAFVQLRSGLLTHIGAPQAMLEASECVKALGTVSQEPTVSRVDVTVDFTSPVSMDSWPREASVTRADEIFNHSSKGRFTGWSIGRGGDITFRLYDKTLEIREKSKKYYLHEIRERNGWYSGDAVWRGEFQLRRAALAQWGIRTLPELHAALPALWIHLTTEWLRLTEVSSSDGNRARWVTHPLWESLQQVNWSGAHGVLERVHASYNSPSDARIAQAGISLVTTVMAKDGLLDVEEAWRKTRAITEKGLEKIEMWEGISREKFLVQRALAKERKYGLFKLAPLCLNVSGQRQPGEH